MARKALGPATLKVVQALEALPHASWLVACSGGADSLALAWAACHVGRKRGVGVRAVVIDHGLQPGSDTVAAQTASLLASFTIAYPRHHLPSAVEPPGPTLAEPVEPPNQPPLTVSDDPVRLAVSVIRVDVDDDGAGPEASARRARYAALEDAVAPGERVLLGHTLDDQAETVLLGLARGSGGRSLAGMAVHRGVFVRPLLRLGREVTRACCAELGLVPWDDPHNADVRFARVRVRERVLPALEREMGPGVREALARTADQLRRDADALDAVAAASLVNATGQGETLHCGWLLGLDAAVRARVVRGWLLARGASEVTAAHVEATASLVTNWRGQRALALPGLSVSRVDGLLTAVPRGARGSRPGS